MILSGERNKTEVESVLDREFMLKDHRTGMERVMQTNGLLVAFRAAGPFSVEKLEFGAAAKPHSILAKTIKPAEVGLGGRIFNELSLKEASYSEENWEDIARRFLCGLVGVRNDAGIAGLYLSSEGVKELGRYVIQGSEDGKGLIRFTDLHSLLSWIKGLLTTIEQENKCALKLSKYFISGDYDIHEIQKKKGGSYQHIAAGSEEEANILWQLSEGALSYLDEEQRDSGTVADKTYQAGEYSPIQHGAQDNYLEFMFQREQDGKLVSKVLLPDTNIAVYCGEKNEWSIIQNNPDSQIVREIQALYDQVRDLKTLYNAYGAGIKTHWDFEDNDNMQVELMEMYGLTPKEFQQHLEARQTELADLIRNCPNKEKCKRLEEYLQFYDQVRQKYEAITLSRADV